VRGPIQAAAVEVRDKRFGTVAAVLQPARRDGKRGIMADESSAFDNYRECACQFSVSVAEFVIRVVLPVVTWESEDGSTENCKDLLEKARISVGQWGELDDLRITNPILGVLIPFPAIPSGVSSTISKQAAEIDKVSRAYLLSALRTPIRENFVNICQRYLQNIEVSDAKRGEALKQVLNCQLKAQRIDSPGDYYCNLLCRL
jgi:hypothetical protein